MSNSYERNIRRYEIFINDKQYINKLINQVKIGKKNSNKAIVEAYNRANVDYRKKSMEYYISKAKAHGGQVFQAMRDDEIRAKIQNLLKNYPSRPPCPTKGGKGNRLKSAEAVAKMCGGYCTRQAKRVCGAVKSVIPGVKRARTNNNNTNTNTNNNRKRINTIRTLVKEGVLKNKVNQNTISIINGMNETQLRRLAKEKGISIRRNLSKPK